MTQAAVTAHGNPAWEVSDWEIRQGGTSYTYHTAHHLRTQHPGAELYWLIGADQLRQLDRWYRAAELFEIVRFAVAARRHLPADTESVVCPGNVASPVSTGNTRASIVRLPFRNVDISSTEIRARLRDGLPVDLFLPEGVRRLIQQQSLYH